MKRMITDYIKRSWQIYKDNWSSFVGATLLLAMISGFLIFLGVAIFLVSTLPYMNFSFIANAANDAVLEDYFVSLFTDPQFLSSLGLGFLAFCVFVLLAMFIATYLGIGQVGMAYEALKKKTSVRTLFKTAGKFGFRWILVLILFVLLFLLLLIPFIIFSILTLGVGLFSVILVLPIISLLAPALVVDNSSASGTFRNAWKAAKKNYMTLFGLWLIYFIVAATITFVGEIFSLIPYIGWLFQLLASFITSFIISPLCLISFVGYYVSNRKGDK